MDYFAKAVPLSPLIYCIYPYLWTSHLFIIYGWKRCISF